MPIFLTEGDVASLLTMPEAMDAVEAAFRAAASGDGAANQPRARLYVPDGVLQNMAAALPSKGVMGTKTYSVIGGRARFYVQLFSTETGELLAFIEADKLGQMRTGAATGVAARYMAVPAPEFAAILGAGWQAESQAEALLVARPGLRGIRVFSRDSARRLAFCERMSQRLNAPFSPAARVEEAVLGTRIVVCVTPAPAPILAGTILTPGHFVSAVGANRLTAREIDEDVVGRANVVAVDDLAQARIESSELLFAHERRKSNWSRIHPFADIVSGRVAGRNTTEDITLFKSLGVALEDVAVAAVIYEKAKANNIGQRAIQ